MAESRPAAADVTVSPEQVRLETSAVIKLVLSQLESTAAMAPEQAAHPHHLNALRHQVVRRIWTLVKLASRAEEPVE